MLACLPMQIGMFCYTGMTPEMVDKLAGLSIYLTRWVRVHGLVISTALGGGVSSTPHGAEQQGFT